MAREEPERAEQTTAADEPRKLLRLAENYASEGNSNAGWDPFRTCGSARRQIHASLLVAAYLLLLPILRRLPESFTSSLPMRPIMALHNLHLFALSFYMCTGIWAEASRRRYSWFGNPADETEEGWPMAKMIWL